MMLMACIVAIGAVGIGRSYPLEAFGFVTGVICVWLAAKENVWNWPIGLLNSAASMVVMFRDRLFADAALYIVYFVSGILGWYWWSKGGEKKDPPPIIATPRKEWPYILASSFLAMGIVGYWMFSVGGAAPAFDTFLTVASLVAQYLMTRKYIECWIVWILVDVLYVPLFLWKGLYLYGILFAIFTVIAYFGLREWKRLRDEAKGEQIPMPGRPLVNALLMSGVFLTVWMSWVCWRFETQMPPKAIEVLRSYDPMTVTHTVLDGTGSKASTLNADQVIHVKANALDPLLFNPLKQEPEANAKPIEQIVFLGIDEKTKQEVELLRYEIFSDHVRVGGQNQSLAMVKKIRPYLPTP